jgi:hypothetical protein
MEPRFVVVEHEDRARAGSMPGRGGTVDAITRFVTIRGPRRPTREELDAGFVVYNKGLGAAVMDAYERGDSEVRSAALAFSKTERFAKTTNDLVERAPGALAWAGFVEREAGALDSRKLEAFARDHPTTADREVMAWLWDNLAAHHYAGGDTAVRDAIIWALRAAHVARSADGLDDDRVRRMATASVVLPKPASTSPAPDGDPPPIDDRRFDQDGDPASAAGSSKVESSAMPGSSTAPVGEATGGDDKTVI